MISDGLGESVVERQHAVGNEVDASVQGIVVQTGSITGDVHFRGGTAGEAAPRQLPSATPHFVNRLVEQDALTTLLSGPRAEGAVLMSTIDGTAGVGKSTLAVNWAHRVRERFPDGELYVNLRGFDPVAEPMTPNEALGFFLAALGVAADRIPAGDDARAAMFRTLVHDKRMLVLLDNARDAAQIRPLLPAARDALVLVASRNRLDELVVREAANRMSLDVLDDAESRELLAHYLGEDALAGDPEAVGELIRHCAGLPLALGVVAVRAVEFDCPLSELVEELSGERERLDALDSAGETGVRAVFSWSYRSLSAEAARLFRLMGLPTGADIGADALAALADRTKRDLRRPLAELLRANLVEQHERGRYRFHDLLRAYAAECAATDERESDRQDTVRRLLDFYLRTSARADYARAGGDSRGFVVDLPDSSIEGLVFGTDAEALAWWDAERHNMRAATLQARSFGLNEYVWQLPRSLMFFFHLRGYADDWIEAYTCAIESARFLGNDYATAYLLFEMSVAHYDRGDVDSSESYAAQSLPYFEAAGDTHGKTEALIGVGVMRVERGDLEDAVKPLETAVSIGQERRDLYTQGASLNGLGLLKAKLGLFGAAHAHFEQALRAYREVGENVGEGFVLHHIADTHRTSGNLEASIEAYRRAAELRLEIDHRPGAAASLRNLGNARHESGDLTGAREALQAALGLYEEIDPDTAAAVLDEIEVLPTS
ncbi:ATP-binding protein [Saccharopolyspora halophila]|uniref:ATP-binding protein n=1 Tax=Saccharopolyspora halophila TaxID=405551 RepID=UPI0031D9897E